MVQLAEAARLSMVMYCEFSSGLIGEAGGWLDTLMTL